MEIEENAFVKMVHHNLKYSSNEVVGIFLGKKVDGLLTIFDAIPLFHNPITSPMLELAFVMVLVLNILNFGFSRFSYVID